MKLGRQFHQPGLFDLPDSDPRPHNARAFLDRAQWHATQVPDWTGQIKTANAPVHTGTAQAAADRAAHKGRTGRSELDEFEIHPVVPHEIADMKPLSDDAANSAESDFQFGQRNERTAPLERGESIPYTNEAEDVGSISHLAPPGGFSTLDEYDTQGVPPKLSRRDMFQQGAYDPLAHQPHQPEIPELAYKYYL
jgi:hypothetical protein